MAKSDAARRIINRDLSDLAFVQRVLEAAEQAANPLLERARYLAISGMLLDEFYRIRVAALREQIRVDGKLRSSDGAKPSTQLKRADKFSNRLILRQDRCWRELREALRNAGVDLMAAKSAPAADKRWLAEYFDRQIKPSLSPQIAQTEATLASIKDGELLLFASVSDLSSSQTTVDLVVPIPSTLPRFVMLPGGGNRCIAIEELLKVFLPRLFAAGTVVECGLARILREGSLKLDDEGDDLLVRVREAIERREHADVIRLRVERNMPGRLLGKLTERLGLLQAHELKALEKSRRRVTKSEFVVADAFLGLADLTQLIDILPLEWVQRHSYSPLLPKRPKFFAEHRGDLFAAIRQADRLLHFPYDDFGVLVDLVEQAATDDRVLSIRQTLYRAGHDSPIVHALATAARNGKSVSAVVEVEAREDEQTNIELAAFLEAAGVHVSFGLDEFKVHAKLMLIERKEHDEIRTYVHCSTGNYSVASGSAYTDICLLSAGADLAADVARVYSYVATGSLPAELTTITIAPHGFRERIEELIQQQIEFAAAGRQAAIWMKLNKLSDEALIETLYRAAQAGVEIDIIVRGICCLRAQVPGLSERIRVKSVVGRFLEHSRAFVFSAGDGLPSANASVYISSADLMPHKLDSRIEMLVPIAADELKLRVQQEVFAAYLRDQANSWALQQDDSWLRQSPSGFSAQGSLAGGSEDRPLSAIG